MMVNKSDRGNRINNWNRNLSPSKDFGFEPTEFFCNRIASSGAGFGIRYNPAQYFQNPASVLKKAECRFKARRRLADLPIVESLNLEVLKSSFRNRCNCTTSLAKTNREPQKADCGILEVKNE